MASSSGFAFVFDFFEDDDAHKEEEAGGKSVFDSVPVQGPAESTRCVKGISEGSPDSLFSTLSFFVSCSPSEATPAALP